MTADTPFGTRIAAVLDESGPLCVGIDPHGALLGEWGLTDDAAGVREFGVRVVDAVAGRAGIVKPQVAFFERHGAAGYAALEEVLAAARAAGLLTIADGKRGDIGSTVDAAGEAWLAPGSPLEADALTAVAYQGLGSLDPVLARAQAAGKGVFVLAATSNPEGLETQRAVRGDGVSVAAGIVAEVARLNAGSDRLGSVGVVIGATVDLGDFGIDPDGLSRTPILVPGFGYQGARIEQAPELFPGLAQNVIVSVSRSILQAGPDGIAAAIAEASREAAAWRE